MSGINPLHEYVRHLIALGQDVVERQRHGESLPPELSRPAQVLLDLERSLVGPSEGSKPQPVSPSAPVSGAQLTVGPGDGERLKVDVEVGAPDVNSATSDGDAPLVIKVYDSAPLEREPAPPVVDVAQVAPETAADAQPAPVSAAGGAPTTCTNCGASLRVGKRFCHRCGTPIADMGYAPDAAPTSASAT